jgi:hypothetical protein
LMHLVPKTSLYRRDTAELKRRIASLIKNDDDDETKDPKELEVIQ